MNHIDKLKNNSIKELNLRACRVNKNDATEIASTLYKNTSLQKLYLWNNLIEVLGTNTSLKKINLVLTNAVSKEAYLK